MDTLKPEDYKEPQCPLRMDGENGGTTPIDIMRAIRRLDEYLSRDDYTAARRHIEYWISEARLGRDERGELAMQNELMGLCRKCGQESDARAASDAAITLLGRLHMTDSVTAATTYINAATVCKAFGSPEDAVELYDRAERIYAEELRPDDARFGGLYNNYALALADVNRFGEARERYAMALEVMRQVPGAEPEMAITYLNLADLAVAERGLEDSEEEADRCLESAEELLDAPGLERNGNYAFVCEKCAPVFDHYGRFVFAGELRQRAREIYERA